MKAKVLLFLVVFAIGLGGMYMKGMHDGLKGKEVALVAEAEAAGGKVTSPTGTAPDRYVYYPGTEKLAKGEVRVIACGTGSMRSGPVGGPRAKRHDTGDGH